MTDIPTRLVQAAALAIMAKIKESVFVDPVTQPGVVGQPFAATEHDLARVAIAAVFAECEVRKESREGWRWLVITTPPWEDTDG